jgi:phage gpG-like protein
MPDLIDVGIDFTALEQRLNFIVAQGENLPMRRIGEVVLESNLQSLDEGGRPTPFQATKRQTGRPPLGGRFGSIGKSEHISEVTSNTVIVSASGLRYSVIHQLGGVIHHPGSMKFQAFEAGGKMVYTNRTRAHDIPIPSRRYFRLLDETVIQIKDLLRSHILSRRTP